MEQIYTDFTTKLLPKIQEGLVITKDYFTDLFGRYVKYLIISDTITAVLMLVLAIGGGVLLYKGIKYGIKEDWPGGEVPMIILGAIGIICGVIFFITSVMNIVKDIYIPEVRVIEKIQLMRS